MIQVVCILICTNSKKKIFYFSQKQKLHFDSIDGSSGELDLTPDFYFNINLPPNKV